MQQIHKIKPGYERRLSTIGIKMGLSTRIELLQEGRPYLTIHSSPYTEAHDSVLDGILSLIGLLELMNNKFDESVIDELKNRIERLKFSE